MPDSPRSHRGGVGRMVVLAQRALGYRAARASLVLPEGLVAVASAGVDPDGLTEVSALAARTGTAQAGDAVAVALRDEAGGVAGVLALGGPPPGRTVADDLEVVTSFAEVLEDQVDLLRRLAPPPPSERVEHLSRAIAGGDISAWFQPLVRLEDEVLVGFEALARWREDDHEVAGPAEFVPLAESAGLVDRLDLAVLADALGHLARWQVEHPLLRLSVNLSGRHLDRTDWLEEVHDAVSAAGVDPATVDLELTESVRPDDVVRSIEDLRRARELGYAVWFDDFGTGWSELRQLIELPADGIKVDRFFTEALGGRGDSVVRAVVQIADDLDLDVVIEGVSTREHATRARELGCRLAQGFLWSPALPPDEVERLLPAWSERVTEAGR